VVAPQLPRDLAIEDLKAVAFADMGDYVEFGPGGRLKLRPEALADPVKMKAVEHPELKENGGFSVRLRDKIPALAALAAHLKGKRPAGGGRGRPHRRQPGPAGNPNQSVQHNIP
jgi:hypothetical protein